MPSQKGHSHDDHENEGYRHEEPQIRLLSQILWEIGKTNDILQRGLCSGVATKKDLCEMENKLMAVLAEVVADLKEAIASAKQTNLDIADVQTKINALTLKVKELEDAIAAGGTSQELADLAKEVKTLTKAADDALPNPIVVPDEPV